MGPCSALLGHPDQNFSEAALRILHRRLGYRHPLKRSAVGKQQALKPSPHLRHEGGQDQDHPLGPDRRETIALCYRCLGMFLHVMVTLCRSGQKIFACTPKSEIRLYDGEKLISEYRNTEEEARLYCMQKTNADHRIVTGWNDGTIRWLFV
jgi:hypothetical protein